MKPESWILWYWLRYHPRFFVRRMLCEVGVHDYDKERKESVKYDQIEGRYVPSDRRYSVVYCQKCCKRKVIGEAKDNQWSPTTAER